MVEFYYLNRSFDSTSLALRMTFRLIIVSVFVETSPRQVLINALFPRVALLALTLGYYILPFQGMGEMDFFRLKD